MAWVSAWCQNLEELSCLMPLKETGLPWMDSSLASGYMIRPWLMTPVQRPTTWPQRRYNFAHSFTHTTVQRNIGWYGKTEVALPPLWSASSATKGMQGYPGLLHAAQLCQTSQTPTSSSQFWHPGRWWCWWWRKWWKPISSPLNTDLLFYQSITSNASICGVCGRACDEMSVSLCLCKRPGLLWDGVP